MKKFKSKVLSTRFLYCPLTDHPFHLYLTEEELRLVRVGLYYVLKNFCFDHPNLTQKDIDVFKHQFDLVSHLYLDIIKILKENENK